MPTQFRPDRLVGGMTNGQRAEWGRIAVKAFGSEVYNSEDEDLETTVSDMMANVLHLAAAMGYDPETFMDDVQRRALSHYEAEAVEEPHEEGEEGSEPPFLEEPVPSWWKELEF